jgi:hypothetical protein
MIKSTFRAFFAVSALAALGAAAGCVSDRPSRNGVFNENQYVRKAFLTTDGTHDDPGWFVKATITQVSTPNALGGMGIFTGSTNSVGGPLGYVKWNITQDKLQMLNLRQIENTGSDNNTLEVVNAWPITNVDLKYRVNLDGEKTNFYEENQELDWQVRQWVKLNFAKNDMSDVAPLGAYVNSALAKCTDLANASATLNNNSFITQEFDDWTQDYMEFAVQITVPLKFDDPTCVDSYGSGYEGLSDLGFGRSDETFTLKYSFMRAKTLDDPTMDANAYVPMAVDEKDPIRHKYGLFELVNISRDPVTRLMAARQLVTRWNPNKPVTYYFLPGMPTYIIDTFLGHRVYDSTDSQNADTASLCLTMGCTRNPDGIKDQTNAVFAKSGAKITMNFLNYNDATTFGDAQGPVRTFGDARYSFIHWIPDIDENNGFLGMAGGASDPRTGEILSAEVNLSDYVIGAMAYQIDFFLQSVGASQGLNYSDPNGNAQEWPSTPPGVSNKATCTVGQTVPLQNSVIQSNHNGGSSLFTKIQQYLGKPSGTYGNLGPQDFIAKQDADFFNAYYTLIPYVVFGDPDMNPFVIREGGNGIYSPPAISAFWQMADQETQFHQIAANIDRGLQPFDGLSGTSGLQNATAFANNFKDLMINHRNYTIMKGYMSNAAQTDPVDALSMTQIADHAARHCVADADGNTHWETKEEWVSNLQRSFYEQIAIHEFGHSLGLRHNFMGSLDQPNFPTKKDAMGNQLKDVNGNPIYTLYTNSVMEYTARMGDIFDVLQWGPYDQGALGWTYGNNAPKPMDPNAPAAKSITGQIDSTHPWNDPLGFVKNPMTGALTENVFMRCQDENAKYTPFCRTFDVGATPSEIISNDLDSYEWGFNFTNYRVYRKFWDNHHYVDAPTNHVLDLRRFLPPWFFDFNGGNIVDTLRRIGYQIPPNVPALEYYTQLENKFNLEFSSANQLVAAFHKAVIQESAGERPWTTIYDSFYGDVTQQGIILDKYMAMQGWTGLWNTSTLYDQNQVGNFTSYSDTGDSSYQAVAEDAVISMIGGSYDAPPYFTPTTVAIFAQDTHNPAFNGRIDIRNWIGGHVFTRVEDFLSYFRDIAVQNYYVSNDLGSINMSQGGTGYTSPPTVVLTGGGGSGATAHAVLGGDFVTQVVIDSTGTGYATAPTVSFSGGGGSGAAATAKLGSVNCTNGYDACLYDPRGFSDKHNEFIGPDKRLWSWAFVPDRNNYVAIQKEVNSASYIIIRAYNDDVVYNLDDGAFPGGAFGVELPMKYFLDAYNAYN